MRVNDKTARKKLWNTFNCMMKLSWEAREEPGRERQRGAELSLEPQTDTSMMLAAVADPDPTASGSASSPHGTRMEVRWSNLGSTPSSLLQQIALLNQHLCLVCDDVAAGPWCLHTSECDCHWYSKDEQITCVNRAEERESSRIICSLQGLTGGGALPRPVTPPDVSDLQLSQLQHQRDETELLCPLTRRCFTRKWKQQQCLPMNAAPVHTRAWIHGGTTASIPAAGEARAGLIPRKARRIDLHMPWWKSVSTEVHLICPSGLKWLNRNYTCPSENLCPSAAQMTETSSCFDKRDETLLIVLGILDHRSGKTGIRRRMRKR